jgi:hypothetical protein
MSEPPKKKRKETHDHFLDELRNDNVSEEVLIEVVKLIGTKLSSDIYEDSLTISSLYKSNHFKEDFEVKSWISKRNKVLTTFLLATANVKSLEENHKKNLCIAGSVDSLLKARNLSTISPIHFYKNLISYYITGSKFITRLNNVHAPAGSYSSIIEWLNNMSCNSLKCTDNGDICTFFDNNQVVARNWRVNYNYKTKASVVTTVINIHPSLRTNIQENNDLNPTNWLYSNEHDLTVKKIKSCISEHVSFFNNIRDQFIKNRLEKVQKDMKERNGCLMDHIDCKISGKYMLIELIMNKVMKEFLISI